MSSLRRVGSLVACAVAAHLALASLASADVKLPALFSDGMVVQRGTPLPVWGWAAPGEEVRVRLGERSQTAKADERGRWRVRLDPLDADEPRKAPLELTVQGANAITVHDVLVGEVWLASGQSNMELALQAALGGEAELARADLPRLRFFVVDKACSDTPREDVGGRWIACDPSSAAELSAIAYFFGRELSRELSAPVGLVVATWGGTPAEAWTSASALEGEPLLEPALELRRAKLAAKGALEPHDAGALWDGMLAPLAPFAIRGVLWYQGESNVEHALAFRKLFPAQVRSWRAAWGQGDFPFLFVQLPASRERAPQPGDSAWAELREAQAAALELPATAMAVTIDLGEPRTIHPRNKQPVAQRLERLALHLAYGRDVACESPRVESFEVHDGTLRVRLAHAEGGLKTTDGGAPRGFALAGEDQVFHEASATVDGDSIVLRSREAPAPVAARYGWADYPDVNLVNAAGLPAAPFRTDSWPTMEERNVPPPSTERRKKRAGR